MDWTYLAGVVLAAVAVSALVNGLMAVWLKRALDRRLEAFGAAAAREQVHATGAERFADVAEEIINLARNATESAIRKEELDEWHRPNAADLGSDDVSEAIRGRLRRASWDAVAATSSLTAAIRKHGEVIPAALEAELATFRERLSANGDDGGSSSDRKRALTAALDALESRFREALGASLETAPESGIPPRA